MYAYSKPISLLQLLESRSKNPSSKRFLILWRHMLVCHEQLDWLLFCTREANPALRNIPFPWHRTGDRELNDLYFSRRGGSRGVSCSCLRGFKRWKVALGCSYTFRSSPSGLSVADLKVSPSCYTVFDKGEEGCVELRASQR